MTMIARSRVTSASASWIWRSVAASTAAVESSKTMTLEVGRTLRAIARRWRWPPERETPRSPTRVS